MEYDKEVVIFCDFDGTITKNDNIISIMKHFNPSGWEKIKNDILTQQISIREGVGRLFSLLPAAMRSEIIKYALKNVEIRPGFEEFLHYCRGRNFRLYITSGGIDFFVYPILERFSIPAHHIYCNGSDFHGEHIKIRWLYACDNSCTKDCGMCKPSILRAHSRNDSIKIVIGDSITDLEIAKLADLVIARDLLSTKCMEHSIPYKEFDSFFDVINILNKSVKCGEI